MAWAVGLGRTIEMEIQGCSRCVDRSRDEKYNKGLRKLNPFIEIRLFVQQMISNLLYMPALILGSVCIAES